ncbi:MAG: hypothetical protein CMG00_08870 [Candidatus Marinimicrobia bacterium]|nr:hypothetical protein [Candidatus Neomarinimicrobiota bacterium]|tara:strand:- start:2928 stop:3263 length:336 start_codon:yes stop_codon:yes gene_type:complete
MNINLQSFLLGVLVCLVFVVFSGGILSPKHLKVSSIEIIDDGENSGYLVIKNIDKNVVTYLGASKSDRGLLTLKNKNGDTKINISSNDDGGYLNVFNSDNSQSSFIYKNND